MNLDWMGQAACAGREALFFGPEGEDPARELVRESVAKRICGWCEVTAECLEYRETLPPQLRPYGVYGGVGEADWKRLVRRRARSRREQEEKAA